MYLVNHHGHPVSRERIIEALWPNAEASAPDTSVKVAIHTLRETLAKLGGEWASISVDTSGPSYVLSAPGLWLDVDEFQRLCATGSRLYVQEKFADAAACYEQAVALYEGPFLCDSWLDWALLRRESLQDQYLGAISRLSDLAFAARDYLGCLLYCHELLINDPCREDSYRTIMLCHAHLGQRARARTWYELCVRTLRGQLDASPEPETEALYIDLSLQRAPTAEACYLPPGVPDLARYLPLSQT
jgi:DNA-binding SARP family transcriptional activator